MGTWNVGNFDNDEALDYVGELMDELEARVDKFLGSTDPDLGEGESMVLPTIVIMQLLSEHTGAAPPKPDLIEKWRENYLAVFDAQIDDFEPADGYKDKRREVIARTFKGFEKTSGAFWNRGGASDGGAGAKGDFGGDRSDEAPQAVTPKSAPDKATTSHVQPSGAGGSAGGASRARRRFEFVEGSSSKFWEIELSGTTYTTTWGRIGTAGSSKTKECPTEARAALEYDKLVEEKTGKGYEEV